MAGMSGNEFKDIEFIQYYLIIYNDLLGANYVTIIPLRKWEQTSTSLLQLIFNSTYPLILP